MLRAPAVHGVSSNKDVIVTSDSDGPPDTPVPPPVHRGLEFLEKNPLSPSFGWVFGAVWCQILGSRTAGLILTPPPLRLGSGPNAPKVERG